MIERLGVPHLDPLPVRVGAMARGERQRVDLNQEEPHGRDFGDRADAFSTAYRQR
jgi:hypothetical protein